MPSPLAKLLAFALTFPETREDHPWGETVAKVRNKVFVFLGPEVPGYPERITVKLDESHDHALSTEGAAPTGYGLGRSGWVTVPTGGLALDLLRDWIEESYRIVAPRRLVAQIDGAPATAKRTVRFKP